jgi:hypothetical protein
VIDVTVVFDEAYYCGGTESERNREKQSIWHSSFFITHNWLVKRRKHIQMWNFLLLSAPMEFYQFLFLSVNIISPCVLAFLCIMEILMANYSEYRWELIMMRIIQNIRFWLSDSIELVCLYRRRYFVGETLTIPGGRFRLIWKVTRPDNSGIATTSNKQTKNEQQPTHTQTREEWRKWKKE